MDNQYVKRSFAKRSTWRSFHRKRWPIVLLLSLIGITVLVTALALIKVNKNEASSFIRPTEIADVDLTPVATPEITPELSPVATPTPTAMIAAGAFGYWDPSSTPTPTKAVPDGYEVWMADWEDTRTPVVAKGIYVTSQFATKIGSLSARIEAFNELLKLCDRTDLNTLVIDMKHESGSLLYRLEGELITPYIRTNNEYSFLKEFIEEAHARGVYVVARVTSFCDTNYAKKVPESAIYNKDGSLYRDAAGNNWVSPFRDYFWDYLIEIGEKCADLGFDEINYDYMRFPTDSVANVDWGPEMETTTKTEAITKGIKKICEALRKKGVYISADVYGIIMSSPVDARSVGQDFQAMSRYLDYICPMVYPSHYDRTWVSSGDWPDLHPYEVVYKSLGYGVQKVNALPDYIHRADIRPWLQDFTANYLGSGRYMIYGEKAVRDQIQAVFDRGLNSYLLWNASGNYTEKAVTN